MLSCFSLLVIAVLLISYTVAKPYWREYQRNKVRGSAFLKSVSKYYPTTHAVF